MELFETFEEGNILVIVSVNYYNLYRTAQATQGLLMIKILMVKSLKPCLVQFVLLASKNPNWGHLQILLDRCVF